MFKKINKKIVTFLMLVVFLVSSSVFGASLTSPTSIPVLQVNVKHNETWSGWKTSADIYKGDTVVFQVHAYSNCDDKVVNLVSKLEDINHKKYTTGMSETVTAYVDADNASRLNGSVNLRFKTNGKFTYSKYKWALKDELNNGSEYFKSFPNGQNGYVLMNSDGVKLGDLANGYRSNVLAAFNVEEYTPAPQPSNGDVDTNGPTNINTTSVRLNGDTDGTDVTNKWFVFSRTDSNPSCSTGAMIDAIGGDNFYADKTALRCDTTYYYRACGENGSNSVISGGVESFRTNACESQSSNGDVDTNSPTNIRRDSIVLNGDTDGSDVNDVWFSFSRTDATPSCTSSTQKIDVGGYREDSNHSFYKYKSELRCDTTYYYRACGENGDGNIVRGDVREVRTQACEVIQIPAKVYTREATNIAKTSAQLNGFVDINDTENGRVYFLYGRSAYNLDKKTAETGVISDDTAFQSIVGLNANTKYYYQAIVKNNEGIVDRGAVKWFVTRPEDVIVTPTNGRCSTYTVNRCIRGYFVDLKDSSISYKWKCVGLEGGRTAYCSKTKAKKTTIKTTVNTAPTPKEINVNVNQITTTTVVVKDNQGLERNKWVSKSKTGPFTESVKAKIGDVIYYKIKVKNYTDKIITGVKVKDFIPAELGPNTDTTNGVDGYKEWVDFDLQPGESKIFLEKLYVTKNAFIGDLIDSAAKITLDGKTNDTNSVEIVVTENGEDVNVDNNKDGQASIFGATSSIFPSSVLGWMLFFIFALIIGLLSVRLFAINRD